MQIFQAGTIGKKKKFKYKTNLTIMTDNEYDNNDDEYDYEDDDNDTDDNDN